jgi:transposase
MAALLTTASPDRFVFLDESFCTTSMAREHGWGPKGARVIGKRPGSSWKTLSLIGAIRLGTKPKLMTHRGPVNRRVFLKFVRQRLVPWLRRGDIVLMDNLAAHKVKGVRAAIESVGAVVIYLPPYSPDMNPIELWWADVKRDLRKRGVRGSDDLARAVRQIRCGTPLAKLEAWFRHALSFPQLN